MIRTLATRSPALNDTPRKESPPFSVGTGNTPRLVLAWSKNSSVVLPAMSTSVNTAPKPLTVAGTVFWLGTKKVASVTVLPIAVNNRSGEKVVKVLV